MPKPDRAPNDHKIVVAGNADTTASADHADDSFVCPASLTQEGLWFIDQIDPGSPTYSIPMVFELRGTIDWGAFQQALDDLVERHESLRTSFLSREGAPFQRVATTAKLEVGQESLLDHPALETEVTTLLQAEADRPFDLTVAPLLRVKAFTLARDRHAVIFVFHHIIVDGWSLGIFFREFSQAYAAHKNGIAPQLPPIAIDFVDFSEWQRQRLTDELRASQIAYWHDVLDGAPDSIAMPTDRPRPAHYTDEGALETFRIGPATTALLRDLSRSEQTTTFMALLGLVNVLIGRHAGTGDVVIGSPISGRIRREIEGTIGFFANTLTLRNTFTPDTTFRELLRRVRATTLGAYQNADVPFHQVARAVGQKRANVAHPLFQIMCAFQAVPDAFLQIEGLDVTPREIYTRTSKFDLLFEFVERRDAIDASLEYRTDLFDASTTRRCIQRLLTLAESAVANPDMPVSALPMLPPSESEQILSWSVGPTVPADDWSTVHAAFERQAQQTPAALAAVFGDDKMTYQELSRRSNQVAQYLVGLGVRAGSAVGLCSDRSSDLIVALLGILKAGACYVPLDPVYPSSRLSLMATDAQLNVIVTNGTVPTDWIPDGSRVVRLDADRHLIEREDAAAAQSRGCGGDLAYIIYTSGSTGRPKGVAMSHAPLTNLLRWQIARSSSEAGRTLQFAPISFDVSFQEIFATLCSGGCLVLIGDDDRRDSHRLLALLREERVNRLFLPFVALQALCEAAHSSGLTPGDLTEVITAGEQLQITPSLTSFFTSLPGCSLDNQYGPTESHVVTAYRLEGPPSQWPLLPPIGRPIDNARTCVLDDRLAPAPIGVPGELYLGGAVLADGYYRNPERTAERFVCSQDEPGARLYRTGDAARWRSDGTLEFLGRLDSQIKVRGHRVELGEIEAALSSVPGIETAAVTAIGDDAGARRLVGYVVYSAGVIEPEKIRHHLLSRLPEYMVPSTFVALERLPLTPSGKVERRALPAPTELPAENRLVSRLPTTPTERKLARIWADLLQVDQVGLDDNFFKLGGHSLLAVKMFARIHDTFGRSIPFSTLLQRPTVGELGPLLDPQTAANATTSCIVPLRTGGSRPPIFFIHGLGNEVWTFVELAKHMDPDQVVYGIQPGEGTSGGVSLADMAERYVAEILAIVPRGPLVVGGFCSGAVTAFEVARQLRANGHKVDLLMVFDYWFEEVPVGTKQLLQNTAYWLVEDLLHTSLRNNIGRVFSKMRKLRNHMSRRFRAAGAIDVRDQLGMWRYPDHEVQRLRGFFDALREYRFEPYDGPIRVFRARTRRLWGGHPSQDMGWGRIAAGRLEIETVPGAHDTMFQVPFVKGLADHVTRAVDEVFERRSGTVSVSPPPAHHPVQKSVRVLAE